MILVQFIKKPTEIIKDLGKYESLILPIAFLSNFFSVLYQITSREWNYEINTSSLFALAVVIAPIIGFILIYLGGYVLKRVGDLFGGEATILEIRTVLAWSYLPSIIAGFLWVLAYFIFKEDLMITAKGKPQNNFIINLFWMIHFALSVWSIMLYFKLLAYVQKFSMLKSIASTIIAIFVSATFLSLLAVFIK